MDALLRIFFSNFTITGNEKGFTQGSTVSYKLNEPYEGFVKANDYVLGAGTGTLTPARFALAGITGLIIDWMRSRLESQYSNQ